MLEGANPTQLEWREEFGSGLFRSYRHDGESLQLKNEDEARCRREIVSITQ
jgi:hypothetical protein